MFHSVVVLPVKRLKGNNKNTAAAFTTLDISGEYGFFRKADKITSRINILEWVGNMMPLFAEASYADKLMPLGASIGT